MLYNYKLNENGYIDLVNTVLDYSQPIIEIEEVPSDVTSGYYKPNTETTTLTVQEIEDKAVEYTVSKGVILDEIKKVYEKQKTADEEELASINLWFENYDNQVSQHTRATALQEDWSCEIDGVAYDDIIALHEVAKEKAKRKKELI